MYNAIRSHAAAPYGHRHVYGQGELQLKAGTKDITVYGGHGLPCTIILPAGMPIGSTVRFRRRNDYAGWPVTVKPPAGLQMRDAANSVQPGINLPRHEHEWQSFIRFNTGWRAL